MTQGIKPSWDRLIYAAHFLGPSDSSMAWAIRIPLAVLLLEIELASHLARVLSLDDPPMGKHVCRRFGYDGLFFSLVAVGVSECSFYRDCTFSCRCFRRTSSSC
jgi:hypothetical protein